MHFKKTMIK